MKLKVNPHTIEIIKDNDEMVNEKEINVSDLIFEFNEKITNDFVKEAYFTTKDNNSYKVIIQNNECNYPQEAIQKDGIIEIGVVAYKVDENENTIIRYNPTPIRKYVYNGSLKNAENTEPITPSDKEQMEQAIQDMETKVDNLDIEAEKVNKTATITITRKDGTQETTEINDGVDGEDGADFQYNWSGTSLGVKTSEEQNYQYVNLKGDKGDAGSIKILIVNELPQVGADDTIYLVPYQEAETGNIYKEYIYVNNTWEELGSIPVEVDLSDYYTKQEVNNLIPTTLSSLQDDSTHRLVTDTEKSTWNNKLDSSALDGYVKNTDYATGNVGGVVKVSSGYNTSISSTGGLRATSITYSQYETADNYSFIGKGTLENVITGKDLTTKSYVDGLVGDIGTALDTIQGEVI